VFNCIKEDIFDISINKNASVMSHKSSELSFKLHLVDDDIIHEPGIPIEKIAKLTFNCEFKLTRDVIREIIKAHTSTGDTNKVYFYTKDNAVYAELTDMSMQNVDSISIRIADSYKGENINTPIAFDLDFFKILNGNKFDIATIKVKTDDGVLLFETNTQESMFKYIVTAYKN
jgi:hypothetical protein